MPIFDYHKSFQHTQKSKIKYPQKEREIRFLKHTKHFPEWLPNRLISGGLEPILKNYVEHRITDNFPVILK